MISNKVIKTFLAISLIVNTLNIVDANEQGWEEYNRDTNLIVQSFRNGKLEKSKSLLSEFKKNYKPYSYSKLVSALIQINPRELQNDQISEQIFTTKIELSNLAAKAGNVKSQYLLGNWYQRNTWGIYDLDKALYWMEKASEQDSSLTPEYKLLTEFIVKLEAKKPEALFNLAVMKVDIYSRERNRAEINRLVSESAEKGYVKAQKWLATRYRLGSSDFNKDLDKALYWYKLAVEQGDEESNLYIEDIEACQSDASVCAEYGL